MRWLAASVLWLALWLRLMAIQEQSFSMDEIAELGFARMPPGDILTVPDGFPPLYHLLLHAWFMVFPADASARWLSALLGTAAVWVVWRLARQAGGSEVGLWTALLVAASPFQIWHAQEARAYVLYYLLAAAAFWAFFTAVRTDSRRAWIAYGIVAWAGLLTHYHFALVVFANLVLLVAERGTHSWRRAVQTHGALALSAIPVLWLLRGDLAGEKGAPFATQFHPAAVGYTFFSFLSGYSLGPSPRELHGMPAREAVVVALPWLLLIGAAGGLLVWHGLLVLGGRVWLRRLMVTTLMPVVLLVGAAGLAGVTFQVRHAIWASIPLMVVLGAGASAWRRKPIAGVALLGLLGTFVLSRYNRVRLPDYQNEDVRTLAAFLRATDNTVPVVVVSGYMAQVVRYYLGDRWKVLAPPGDAWDAAVRTADSAAVRGTPFWLVYTREFHADPTGGLLDSLGRVRELHRQREFPGILLFGGDGAGQGIR